MSVPALVRCEADTPIPLPHLTWHDDWRDTLAQFTREAPDAPVIVERIPPRRTLTVLAHKLRQGRILEGTGRERLTRCLPLDVIEGDLYDRMMALAWALYETELPENGGAIVTRMFDGGIDGDMTGALFGWLTTAIAHIAGDESASSAPPTAGAGNPDGTLELHSDCWIPALLLNVFNEVVPLQGEPLLLHVDDMWPIAEAEGVPVETLDHMKAVIAEAGSCDFYDSCGVHLYDGPWCTRLEHALYRAAYRWEAGRGQGYVVNDREWMHGRTIMAPVPPERVVHRLYRLVWNNARLQAEVVARRKDWLARGYTPLAVPEAYREGHRIWSGLES